MHDKFWDIPFVNGLIFYSLSIGILIMLRVSSLEYYVWVNRILPQELDQFLRSLRCPFCLYAKPHLGLVTFHSFEDASLLRVVFTRVVILSAVIILLVVFLKFMLDGQTAFEKVCGIFWFSVETITTIVFLRFGHNIHKMRDLGS